MAFMRTIPETANQPLRDAIAYRRAPIELLLASTVLLAHDGSLEMDEDGSLPKGTPLPIDVERGRDGAWLIDVCADRDALRDRDAAVVPIAGDDLIVLASANTVGVRVNPGRCDDLLLDAARVRAIADAVQAQRAAAGVERVNGDVLVTMRRRDLGMEEDRETLLRRELRARGIDRAYVVEYALHDAGTAPSSYTQLAVVGDSTGAASWRMREDARRVLTFLTGRPTDAVALADMPQAARVADAVV